MQEMADEMARQLMVAETRMTPIPPLTDSYPDLTVEQAYRVQLQVVAQKLAHGRQIVGKKVGLTSKAMQQMLGVHEPDYGHLFDDMMVVKGSTVQIRDLIAPKAEAEIGFVLRSDLCGPNLSFIDVLMATEYIVPTIEIVDSRIADWRIRLEDTVADNGSSCRVVVGTTRSQINGKDLRNLGMVLYKNGVQIATGSGAAVLGHPANAIAWLGNKLSEFDVSLRAGELILPGALSAAIAVEAGDTVEANFGWLGRVSVSFA